MKEKCQHRGWSLCTEKGELIEIGENTKHVNKVKLEVATWNYKAITHKKGHGQHVNKLNFEMRVQELYMLVENDLLTLLFGEPARDAEGLGPRAMDVLMSSVS
jgi:hypothetical protein